MSILYRVNFKKAYGTNNICIDRNCHQKKLSKKSLPNAQELFWLGGGIQCLPPTEKGLRYKYQ